MKVIGIVGTEKCVISFVDNYRKIKNFYRETFFVKEQKKSFSALPGN